MLSSAFELGEKLNAPQLTAIIVVVIVGKNLN
jgi:hypothetical protein